MMGVRRRRKRRVERDTESGQDREALKMLEDILSDFSIDELREFLEADLVDVKGDPEFKERLRKRLCDLGQDRAAGPQAGHHRRGPPSDRRTTRSGPGASESGRSASRPT